LRFLELIISQFENLARFRLFGHTKRDIALVGCTNGRKLLR